MSIAWFNIAAKSGDKDAVDARAEAVKILTLQQVAEGQNLTRELMKAIKAPK